MNVDQINALNRFAKSNGRNWREPLLTGWHTGKALPKTSAEDAALLQQLRNDSLPVVHHFKPVKAEFRHVAFLKEDIQERISVQRSWRAKAWRIVDAAGKDLFQPWCASRTEARQLAANFAVFLVE